MNTIMWANVALCILLSAGVLAQSMARRAVLKRQTVVVRGPRRPQ